MNKSRLEAFSDGVIAIILTIMVLELKVPHNPTWQSYVEAYPIFISYALSFISIGLFWSNHHTLFYNARKIDNRVIWANMAVLFFQSFIPFTTATVGENSFSSVSVTMYAVVLILSFGSYIILTKQLHRLHGDGANFSRAFTQGYKIYLTIALHAVAAIISILGLPKIAFVIIGLAALMWFTPNHTVGDSQPKKGG